MRLLLNTQLSLHLQATRSSSSGSVFENQNAYTSKNIFKDKKMKANMPLLKQKIALFMLIAAALPCLAQTAERPAWDIKDRWEYKLTQKNDGNKVSEYSHEIKKIEDGKIIITRQNKNAEGVFAGRGEEIYSSDMNFMSASANQAVRTPDSRMLQWPLEVGKKYAAESEWTNTSTSQKGFNEYKATVESYEDVTVPAGTFKAYKVVLKGFWNRRDTQFNGSGRSTQTLWYAPDAKRWVKWVSEDRSSNGQIFNDDVAELLKYTSGK